ncbi:methyl-accepting chemotaxis protein [Thermodesulfobacteriota bacterium]
MIKKFRLKSIKEKTVASVGILILLFLIFFVVSNYQTQKCALVESNKVLLQGQYEQILNSFAAATNANLAVAGWAAEVPEVKESLAGKKTEKLTSRTLPVFSAVNNSLNIDRVRFFDSQGYPFIGLTDPDISGMSQDDNAVVLASHKEGQSKSGIEKKSDGLWLVAASLVSHNDTHAGIVEFSTAIDTPLVQQLNTEIAHGFSLFIPDGERFNELSADNITLLHGNLISVLNQIIQTKEQVVLQEKVAERDNLMLLGPLNDYRGISVGIVAIASDLSEQMAALMQQLLLSIAVGVAVMVLIMFTTFKLMENMINKPVQEIVEKFKKAGSGDLTQRLPTTAINCSSITNCGKQDCSMFGKVGHCWEEAGSLAPVVQCPKIINGVYKTCAECDKVFQVAVGGEMAELYNYFNSFMNKFQVIIHDIYEHHETLTASSTELATISESISGGSNKTSIKSNSVAAAAEEMSSNMNSVAAATEEAATNVSTVAASLEEMAATTNEIAQNTEKARMITSEAVIEARNASETVERLGIAANEIGKVTETITEISAQTNLLALNATIEAARAGAAGKGFAVVANEIKELARQTAGATGEIKSKIEGIQSSTDGTVDQIEQISKVINKVNEIVTGIASAAEEQSVTTGEIADNVIHASQGISEITNNVSQSSTVAQEVASDIAAVNLAAQDMTANCIRMNENAGDLTYLASQLMKKLQYLKV